MGAGEIAQVVAAVSTAAAAGAALVTARGARAEMSLAREENAIAREALVAQTQPLITDVPWGVIREEVEQQDATGRMKRRLVDRSEISVGTYGSDALCTVSVPMRNVGNGCARILSVVFVLPDGSEVDGSGKGLVLPASEWTIVGFGRARGDADYPSAAAIALELTNFTVVVVYADAAGRPREVLHLDVENGRLPRISDRRWTPPAVTDSREVSGKSGAAT